MPRPAPILALAVASVVLVALAAAGEVRGAPASAAAAGGVVAGCPPGMVLAPAATATLGAPDDPDALPLAARAMSALCVDRTEVTVGAYRSCAGRGACPAPERTVSFPGFGPPEPMRAELSAYCNAPREGRDGYPMNCVEQASAAAYCAAEGKRLPREDEWEYAARGASGARFPWGDAAPDGRICWDRRATGEGTCAVGQFPAGASPFGALDMSGDVWEWTSSGQGGGIVVRGGGWTNFLPRFVRSTYRWPLPSATRLNCLGFRCVKDPG